MADAKSRVHDVITNEDVDDLMQYYDKWNDDYDADLESLSYTAPNAMADLCVKHLNKNDKILDICAGTGLVAKLIKPLGFQNIDGHDGSAGMIEFAKKHDLYRQYYVEIIRSGRKPEVIPADSYDVLALSGAVGQGGHLDGSHFPELLAPLKAHGKVMITSRKAGLEKRNDDGKTILENFEELEKSGVWKLVEKTDFPNYMAGIAGTALVYEKL